jgi:hypothetical protein
MSEGVRNLIDAIINGDSIQIDQSFNHEMAERISTRLDAMRVEVAKNMFNEQVEELEEELDEEQLDEMINEVLSKDATAGEWIDDFVHSKDPKFASKSKEKRKQMALAAYYAKQRNESVEDLDEEQLDELSKDTLKSYIDKAATRLVSGDKYKGMDRYNRVDGIKKATSKLVKQEETEQIDEVMSRKQKRCRSS